MISRSGCNFSSLPRWGFYTLDSVKNPWGFLSHKKDIRWRRTRLICRSTDRDVYIRAYFILLIHLFPTFHYHCAIGY